MVYLKKNMFNKEEYRRELYEKYSKAEFQNQNLEFYKQKFKVRKHTILPKSIEIVALLILCFGVSVFAYNEVTKKNIEDAPEIKQEINKFERKSFDF